MENNGTRHCTVYAVCNHLQPLCEPACSTAQYCTAECTCQALSAHAPDVVPRVSSISISTRSFANDSCALFEKCIPDAGTRKLMRFAVSVVNQGEGKSHRCYMRSV